LLQRFNSLALSIERRGAVLSSIFSSHPHDDVDLAYDVAGVTETEHDDTQRSALSELFDALVWAAVPKSRRSRERRAIRRFGIHKIREYMTPKSNIMACLECGHYHEAHTICGNCYEKVRDETEVLRSKMDVNTRLYNAPHSEVVYLYKGEEDDRKKFNGKFIVEVDKSRPEWFPKNLLSKGHGNYK